MKSIKNKKEPDDFRKSIVLEMCGTSMDPGHYALVDGLSVGKVSWAMMGVE